MRIALLSFALSVASTLAYAQSFEASVSGGVSAITNNNIGSGYTLGDGFRLAFRMGLNPGTHIGTEFGYAYNRSQLQSGGQQQGFGIHQGFLDGVWHFTSEKFPIRPFVAAGVQFSNFVPPGSSAQYGQGDNKFGVNYGGGIKAKVHGNWQVRLDFRQYEMGKPFSLPGGSGRLFMNEISAGVGYAM
jgi:opacity protein-like surface antigen